MIFPESNNKNSQFALWKFLPKVLDPLSQLLQSVKVLLLDSYSEIYL